MSERDKFLQTFSETRNAQIPNDWIDIQVAGRRCNIVDLAGSKNVMAWKLKASWRDHGSSI